MVSQWPSAIGMSHPVVSLLIIRVRFSMVASLDATTVVKSATKCLKNLILSAAVVADVGFC